MGIFHRTEMGMGGGELTVAMASTPPATPPAMKDTDGGTGAFWAGIVHDALPKPSILYRILYSWMGCTR